MAELPCCRVVVLDQVEVRERGQSPEVSVTCLRDVLILCRNLGMRNGIIYLEFMYLVLSGEYCVTFLPYVVLLVKDNFRQFMSY